MAQNLTKDFFQTKYFSMESYMLTRYTKAHLHHIWWRWA